MCMIVCVCIFMYVLVCFACFQFCFSVLTLVVWLQVVTVYHVCTIPFHKLWALSRSFEDWKSLNLMLFLVIIIFINIHNQIMYLFYYFLYTYIIICNHCILWIIMFWRCVCVCVCVRERERETLGDFVIS